ncbi:hypothetical protein ACFQ3P_01225 [Paraburkholderia sabiae]|uniref:Uncharacterized protein n=1 Tax=Paraburkholderia sabiae TaxID=273251 RepID=A0ABU9Q973_9BURK|nr:hypothetical protein [Paraburkholderia sabiae]WJZ79250.1 hypothetical protein QEN71_31440 [Paraburkholderia sabiae]CAG9205973.1 hypothetical protein PSAB6_250081 [Paraburkholderia sabiae]
MSKRLLSRWLGAGFAMWVVGDSVWPDLHGPNANSYLTSPVCLPGIAHVSS